MNLNPVILSVTPEIQRQKGRELHQGLSQAARQALQISAGFHGVILKKMAKNLQNVPQPEDGWFWSVSHKKSYVCAVVSRIPVGIDVEKIRSVREGLWDRVASQEEWRLSGECTEANFFRVWTAKESILKATGIGISGVEECRIREVRPDQVLVEFGSQKWKTSQVFHDEHVFAVTFSDPQNVIWHVHTDT